MSMDPLVILQFGFYASAGHIMAYGDVDKDDRAIFFMFNKAREKELEMNTPGGTFKLPPWYEVLFWYIVL